MGTRREGRKGITLLFVVAIAVIAAVVIFFALSYDPQTTSPTTFGDPTPMIELIYERERFEGQLISASLGVGEQPQLPGGDQDITSVAGETINIQEGSAIQFEVSGESSLEQPTSLAANVYTDSGSPVGILSIQQERSPYELAVDLPPANYILMITATWTTDPTQSISGYVVYGYRINVV